MAAHMGGMYQLPFRDMKMCDLDGIPRERAS